VLSVSNDLIIQWLDAGAEPRNFDYKTGFKWQDKTKQTLEIVADIMGFSNTRDGGFLIIGFNGQTKEFAGESGNWWDSFDTTNVMDTVNKYCEPRVNVTVSIKPGFDYKSKRGALVILEISEFGSVPTICVKDGNTSTSENIFRKAQIFIRTNRASIESISNSDDMRDLINRATVKNGESILSQFFAITKGTQEGGQRMLL
jgi:hypothetical protein